MMHKLGVDYKDLDRIKGGIMIFAHIQNGIKTSSLSSITRPNPIWPDNTFYLIIKLLWVFPKKKLCHFKLFPMLRVTQRLQKQLKGFFNLFFILWNICGDLQKNFCSYLWIDFTWDMPQFGNQSLKYDFICICQLSFSEWNSEISEGSGFSKFRIRIIYG